MRPLLYYPTEVTEAQWTLRLAIRPARKWRSGGPGRPPGELRQVLTGLFYLRKTGCQGRRVPRECGTGKTLSA
jgi:transposase